jgi:hypothetical protein
MRGVEQIPWIYDAMCWVAERNGLIRWRRRLVGGARGRTLEVGIGTGRNLTLYDRDLRVVGVEPDRGVVPTARRRSPSVPTTRPLIAWWQDRIQPLWTVMAGGCHPNRDTERTVEETGFEIHEEGRRRRGNLRLFNARKRPA